MSDITEIVKKIKLNRPHFIAAWPGMGNVAMTAITYLRDKIGASLLAEIATGEFFTPTGATVSKQIIKSPEKPSNQFYYYKSPTHKHDILIFIGSAQPIPHKEHIFAMKVLEFAKAFNAHTVFTTAAAPSDMDYRDTPRVFAVPNDPVLLRKMAEYNVHFMKEGNITGMNGLLIAVAGEMGIQGISLLGEIPFFTAQIEFPKAAIEVLKVMIRYMGIRIDMVDLELYANDKEKEIAPLAGLLMKNGEEEKEHSQEKIVPDTEVAVPKSVRLKIEKMFRQAEFDDTYKSKMQLKEELDKWGLFDDYLDRFLDLFKKA